MKTIHGLIVALTLILPAGLHAQDLLQNGDFSDGTNHWRGDCKPAGADNTHDFVSNSQVTGGVTVELHHSTYTRVTQELKGNHPSVTVTIQYTVSGDYKPSDNPRMSSDSGAATDELIQLGVGGSNKGIGVFISVPPPQAVTAQNTSPNVTTITTHPPATDMVSFIPDTTPGTHTFTRVLTLRGFGVGTETFGITCPPGEGSVTITKVSLVPAAGNGIMPGGYPGMQGGYQGGYHHPQQPPTQPANQ